VVRTAVFWGEKGGDNCGRHNLTHNRELSREFLTYVFSNTTCSDFKESKCLSSFPRRNALRQKHREVGVEIMRNLADKQTKSLVPERWGISSLSSKATVTAA
jgi:hypothetical protein